MQLVGNLGWPSHLLHYQSAACTIVFLICYAKCPAVMFGTHGIDLHVDNNALYSWFHSYLVLLHQQKENKISVLGINWVLNPALYSGAWCGMIMHRVPCHLVAPGSAVWTWAQISVCCSCVHMDFIWVTFRWTGYSKLPQVWIIVKVCLVPCNYSSRLYAQWSENRL